MPDKVICKNINGLHEVSVKLLTKYPSRKIFAFYGELGAGKTTFIKTICKSLRVADIVNSPTFAIINVYEASDGENIYHFDFYRLKSIEEVFDIGYEDYFYSGSYCFIEWPEKIENLLPDHAIKVYIEVDKSDGSRIIKF
ncbi:MAG: tRNA (adenosine(37)-N6)-threonylcarbamoyltransferase complex ATPase subunit type 1 TsaE [Bacteroidetes bacterium]|nr:tRNA (adenosine(37)-N6)-threonylcarbamoyltransferase complex ATPase subunit type 1 TsaE [Bacteroidota bacterium]MBL7105335.1 tRNA (adenosine(37)-N6)-threonylcarbamoyltransferase complex ATPase subunit type 1 TsaE [Bacteroidales bacterium]